jgi:hypothetical protein
VTVLKPHNRCLDTFPGHFDGYIYMVIDGALLPTTSPGQLGADNEFIFPLAHPIHWHGSDVVVLAQDTNPYDPSKSPANWKFDNPPRRDVVLVPAGGYIAIAFKPDNPGVSSQSRSHLTQIEKNTWCVYELTRRNNNNRSGWPTATLLGTRVRVSDFFRHQPEWHLPFVPVFPLTEPKKKKTPQVWPCR